MAKPFYFSQHLHFYFMNKIRRDPTFHKEQLKTRILEALSLSITAKDQQSINKATEIITTLKTVYGFLPVLLNMVQSQQITDQNLVCAILIQIKRFLNQRKRQTNITSINHNDYEQFLDNLMVTNVSLSQNYKFSKIMKDIIYLCGRQAIAFSNQVAFLIESRQQLRASLNYVLGVAKSFKFAYQVSQTIIFTQFLETFLPLVQTLIQDGEKGLINLYDQLQISTQKQQTIIDFNNNSIYQGQLQQKINNYHIQKCYFDEIVYLSIKFAQKVLKKDIHDNVRPFMFKFANIALSRLSQMENIYIKDVEQNPTNCGIKGSNKFNYMHGKKWACKYMVRFMERILVIDKTHPFITHSTINFLQEHKHTLFNIIHRMITIPQPTKIKFYQLKTLQTMVKTRGKYLFIQFQKEKDYYQLEVLPQYIYLTIEQKQLAEESPMEFLNIQNSDSIIDNLNSRRLAINIWVQLCKNSYKYLPLFKADLLLMQNLNTIELWLISKDDCKCEMAAMILIRLTDLLFKQRQDMFPFVEDIIKTSFQLLLSSENLLLHARAMELINCYSSVIQDDNFLMIVKQFILTVFRNRQKLNPRRQNNKNGLVVIRQAKSAIAFVAICQKPWLRKLDSLEPKVILHILLEMVQFYEQEEIMKCLTKFIVLYAQDIIDYACELVSQMGEWFCNYLNFQLEQAYQKDMSQYNKNAYFMIDGSLKIIQTFIPLISKTSNQLHTTLHTHLETQIIKILVTTLSSQKIKDYTFTQSILLILSTYLDENKKTGKQICQQLWYFYRILLYRIVGLPPSIRKELKQMKESMHKKILQNCKQPIQYQQKIYLKVLRSYIQYINPNEAVGDIKRVFLNTPPFNNMDILFYAIVTFYQKQSAKEREIYLQNRKNRGRVFSSLLLVYLLQNHGQSLHQTVNRKIYGIICANSSYSEHRMYLIKYNTQLFSLWLWNFSLSKINTSLPNQLQLLINSTFAKSQIYGLHEIITYQQRVRTILGLCSVIKLKIQKNPESLTNLQLIYYIKWLFYYIHNNVFDNSDGYNIDLDNNRPPDTSIENVTQLQQHNKRQIKAHDQNNDPLFSFAYDLDQYPNQNYQSNLDQLQIIYFLDMLHLLKERHEELYQVVVLDKYNTKLKDILKELNLHENYQGLYKGDIYKEQDELD